MLYFSVNNRPLVEDVNMRIIGTGPSSSLLIVPTELVYYRQYKCIATNTLGRAQHYIELRLANPPRDEVNVCIIVTHFLLLAPVIIY